MPTEHFDRDAEQGDKLPPDSIEHLRAEIAVGMEQSRRGESRPLDIAAIKQKVRENAGEIRRGS